MKYLKLYESNVIENILISNEKGIFINIQGVKKLMGLLNHSLEHNKIMTIETKPNFNKTNWYIDCKFKSLKFFPEDLIKIHHLMEDIKDLNNVDECYIHAIIYLSRVSQHLIIRLYNISGVIK